MEGVILTCMFMAQEGVILTCMFMAQKRKGARGRTVTSIPRINLTFYLLFKHPLATPL